VIYANAFFDLQLRFARKVSLLSGLPLARALLEYTNLYIRFGLGRGFDPAHPTWQEYLAGLGDARDLGEWTFAFYSRRPDAMAAPSVVATFGCFSYARPSAERIRLHFENTETDGQSPLAAERVPQRSAELAALFAHVKRSPGPPPRVRGECFCSDSVRQPTASLRCVEPVPSRHDRRCAWGLAPSRFMPAR